MILERVDFDYSLGAASFDRFSYSFAGAPPRADRDMLLSFAKDSIGSLEGVLDLVYPHFSKTMDGEVSSSSIAQGYNYRSTDFANFDSSRLRYELRLDAEGRAWDASVRLWVSDRDEDRLLGLHDSVVMMSGEISREARVQLDRIEHLRSQPFVVERYLELEAP